MGKRRGIESIHEWKLIWRRAFDNMPNLYGFHRHEVREEEGCERAVKSPEGCLCDGSCIVGVYRTPYTTYGKLSTLAKVLDLPMKSKAGWVRGGHVSTGGRHVGHLRVEAAMYRGSIPRDPETLRKLMILASSLGPIMAWRKLEKLGVAHRYVKPY